MPALANVPHPAPLATGADLILLAGDPGPAEPPGQPPAPELPVPADPPPTDPPTEIPLPPQQPYGWQATGW